MHPCVADKAVAGGLPFWVAYSDATFAGIQALDTSVVLDLADDILSLVGPPTNERDSDIFFFEPDYENNSGA